MNRPVLQILLAAGVVALAGCTGGVLTSTAQARNGTVTVWISDEPNAMDDFEHLNVTVTSVGFYEAGENGTWVERKVSSGTVVDLTELRGANASMLEQFELPNGTYDNVFVHVGEVDGTLTTGESVTVKLPGEKLHVNRNVTVGNGTETDFVFDISVHKAGNSGTYILKPVVTESGSEVPIEPVDGATLQDGTDAGDGTGADEADAADAAADASVDERLAERGR